MIDRRSVSWQRKKERTSDRCQNSQRGVVIGGVQGPTEVTELRMRRTLKARK